jgi:3'-phosphoadenosine 5'-phosphosulfate sulfotransferase (PAPS reductase)/FAD synthetase
VTAGLIRINRPGRVDRGVVTHQPLDKKRGYEDLDVAPLLRSGAPVAIGVSGGKDSCACALATVAHLDTIGHVGPRVLIHSDLGRVEWRDSLPTCERVAAATGLDLVIVRRTAGDMMDRWLSRWDANLRRYAALECVKLILPWSTPSMRFCTSELKTAIICRELVQRFPGQTIVSASGIRRDESAKRKKSPIAKVQKKLTSATNKTHGLDWHPIIEWTEPDVYAFLAVCGFDLHEAYTRFGMSRVSCVFCIMSALADLIASGSCPDNHAIYREMVGLEVASTFAFQGSRWLADVAPHLLDDVTSAAVGHAKLRAQRRELAEARIPDHLLYEEGWPRVMPTEAEAETLCGIRRAVAAAVEIEIDYTEPVTLRARYADLMAERAAKEAR